MYVIACHGRRGYLSLLKASPGVVDGVEVDLEFSYEFFIHFEDIQDACCFLDVLTDIFDDENFIIMEI